MRKFGGLLRTHTRTDGDDDSAAVTFWSKSDTRELLRKSLKVLDEHFTSKANN